MSQWIAIKPDADKEMQSLQEVGRPPGNLLTCGLMPGTYTSSELQQHLLTLPLIENIDVYELILKCIEHKYTIYIE